MDGDRAPTLTEAELNDVAHCRGCAHNEPAQVNGDYCIVRRASLDVVLRALDRLVRRDGLMRKQLAAEQAKNRRRK